MQDFQTVYERNIDRVYRVCYLRLGHREDAEDAAQNVFARWLRSGKTFETEEHEKAYFLRAACNESLNMKRSFWNRGRMDFDDLPEALTAVEGPEPAETDTGEILRDLPARYRDVLYLYYYEELSTVEVAKALGRNESTVRTQLQKGRERLRELLTKGDTK
ncbi:MAG: RNA polymerase sigma factor [Clostridia bacterium]|nr:RNA polymerase sigma factor [Clostridia bacterium]